MCHYPPIRALSVIARTSIEGVHALLQSKLEKLLLRGTHFINVDDWSENEISTKYKCVIGIVNCTKIPINTWQTNAFSKKKGCATLKYQVVIHHATGKPLSVYGSFKGSVHDAKICEKSDIAQYLLNYNLKLIGDKAYVGSCNVLAPIKKNNRFFSKTQRKRYNRQLTQV
jgi:hypothetical protein